MTFCSVSEECANEECPRWFGPEDAKRAVHWWGGADYPLALSNLESADCGFISKFDAQAENYGTDHEED